MKTTVIQGYGGLKTTVVQSSRRERKNYIEIIVLCTYNARNLQLLRIGSYRLWQNYWRGAFQALQCQKLTWKLCMPEAASSRTLLIIIQSQNTVVSVIISIASRSQDKMCPSIDLKIQLIISQNSIFTVDSYSN